jgi:tRNA threonylcarbamoyladenosine biosynthesis protein TsaB
VKVLALDAALEACQAAVLDGDRVLSQASEPMQRGHQEALGPMVQAVMASAGVRFDELDRIAVTLGPGSFTGVRVGLAFAKGLALALHIPLTGLGTLEALTASAAGEGLVTAVIDGRRGNLYVQSFKDGSPLGPPRSIPVEDARRELAALGPQRLVGPGAHLLEGLPGAQMVALTAPDPAALGRLAAAAAGEPAAPPRPIYLRAPDARPSA